MKSQTPRAHIPARIGAALAAASPLVGCATPNTTEQNLKKFGAGEVTTYVIVAGPPRNVAELLQRPSARAELCEGVNLPDAAKPARPWSTENICTGDRARQWQWVPGVYCTSAFGGIQTYRALDPAGWPIEVDDILEVSIHYFADGTQAGPALCQADRAQGQRRDEGQWLLLGWRQGLDFGRGQRRGSL